jgi:hypothetical protein
MSRFLIRRLSVVAVMLLATAILAAAGTGSIHAQSTSTTGTCDQFDSFCNYCANNPGSDLCQTGANPSMVAIVFTGPSMGSSPMMGSMGSSSMMASGSAPSVSTTTSTTGTCDQFDSFCNYCANNSDSDLCQPGANASMVPLGAPSEMMMNSSSMSMGSMPTMGQDMTGMSWIWCGATWVPMSTAGVWPC